MSFVDGKPHVLTERQVSIGWSGSKGTLRMRCKLCGHRFHAGETYRFIYANGGGPVRGGNFMVCTSCDDDNTKLLERMAAAETEGYRRFWWLIDDDNHLERVST